MSTIGPAAQLAALLRLQGARLPGTATSGARHSAVPHDAVNGQKPAPGQPSSSQAAGDRAAKALSRRLSAISSSDPDRRRKAMRLFLEATLLREWGDDAVNDPAFQQLVDQVHDEMCQHEQLRLQMEVAADQLLALRS